MRVCWIIDSLGPGGAEALVPRFATAAQGTDVQLQVVVLRSPRIAPHAGAVRDAGVTVTSLDARNLRDPVAFRRLLRRLRTTRPDVLHAHLEYAIIWGALASWLLDIPLVATLHELPGARAGSFRARIRGRLMYRLLRWRAAAVVAVSEAAARAPVTAGLLPAEMVRVVRNGAPRPTGEERARSTRRRLRSELGVATDAPLMISVAVLRPDKGLDVAIRALTRIQEELPGARLLIVGTGPQDEDLRALAERSGIADGCIFAGRRDDVQDLYAAADLLVHPSREEALPTVVLEAMAAGLPVVATDVGGTAELVTPGRSGLLVPPDSPEALAAATVSLLQDPDRARSMGHAGRDRAVAALGPDRWLEQLRAVYADAAGHGRLASGVRSVRGAR